MHSYCNKLLPNNFHAFFTSISSVHTQSKRISTPNNLFLRRVNTSSGKCSLGFVCPKGWPLISGCMKSLSTFTFKWQLKEHLSHEKDTWLCILATFNFIKNKMLFLAYQFFSNWGDVSLFVFYMTFFFSYPFLCTSHFFPYKIALNNFFVFLPGQLFFYFLFFYFIFQTLYKHYFDHTKFPQLNLFHSYVNILACSFHLQDFITMLCVCFVFLIVFILFPIAVFQH